MKSTSIYIAIVLSTIACQSKVEQRTSDISERAISDVSAAVILDSQDHREIYSIINGLIADGKLNRNYVLKTIAEETSEYFLRSLVIEHGDANSSQLRVSSDGKLVLNDSAVLVRGPERCLESADVDHMLMQEKQMEKFQWDNSRLGFQGSNKKEWYTISVPLFSADSSKAVVRIFYRCDQFLCGTDETLLLTSRNGRWIPKTIDMAVH